MDMGQELIQDAPIPFTGVRVGFIIPVHIEDMQSATAHLQVDDYVHPPSLGVVFATVWNNRRDGYP
eukprot:703832-Amphidinium_carterae.1